MCPLGITLAAIILGLIMILVSVGIVSFAETLGAHRDTNETFALSGRLTEAREMFRDSWRDPLKMFQPNDRVYRIVLEKGEAEYGFFAALPESPKEYIGRQIILEYSRVLNIFGQAIMVENIGFEYLLPSPDCTPIYGKITINTCANE